MLTAILYMLTMNKWDFDHQMDRMGNKRQIGWDSGGGEGGGEGRGGGRGEGGGEGEGEGGGEGRGEGGGGGGGEGGGEGEGGRGGEGGGEGEGWWRAADRISNGNLHFYCSCSVECAFLHDTKFNSKLSLGLSKHLIKLDNHPRGV